MTTDPMGRDKTCRYNSGMGFKKGFNPFYVLLVVVGTVFCLTACAYGLMAMRALRPDRSHDVRATAGSADADGVARPGPHQLLAYMERNGENLLLVELAVLTVATFAAMVTDSYWIRRAAEKQRLNREAAVNSESTATEEQSS